MFLLLLLFVAAILDFYRGKIPNELIFAGFMAGIPRVLYLEGWQGFLSHIPAVLFPLVLLFPLYCIGALGAGDIKLFSMMGCFLSLWEVVFHILFSFLIGAFISLFLLIRRKNFISRMSYLFFYLQECISTGHFRYYYQNSLGTEKSLEEKNSSTLHFAIPILFSFLLYKVYYL